MPNLILKQKDKVPILSKVVESLKKQKLSPVSIKTCISKALKDYCMENGEITLIDKEGKKRYFMDGDPEEPQYQYLSHALITPSLDEQGNVVGEEEEIFSPGPEISI